MNPMILAAVAALAMVSFEARAEPLPQSTEKASAARVAKKLEKARERAAHQEKEDNEAVRDFQKAASKYDGLHNSLLARLGQKQDATAQALAQAIATSRARAKQGDVFHSEVEPLLRRLIGEQLKGPDAADARKTLLDSNLGEEEQTVVVKVGINAVYPPGATRAGMPPSVLLTLPALPPSLHYRFVGRDLVLVDSVAQIIVDYLTAAVPGP